jgi:epoxyqueuosine reductase
VTLTQEILSHARLLGFDLVGIAPVGSPGHFEAFEAWLAAGRHGEMAYMANRPSLRADPDQLAAGARAIIVVGANYHAGPRPDPADPSCGHFARYAWSADYHDVFRSALHGLDAFIRARSGRNEHGKACVDTAPLLERAFAAQAGVGFVGRNTCLITPGLGSWTFLGALLVPESLDLTAAPITPGRVAAGCGRCSRCLNACPTGALVAPYVLDARRCISYLTIELRGSIPIDLRPRIGNWIFGCDICQQVCPYNRAAPDAGWPALAPDRTRTALPLLDLLALGEADFRVRFRGTPVLRAKRRGLVRNACVAAGNWGNPAAVPILARLLEDLEPAVRGHAAWALGRIGGAGASRALAHAIAVETDPWVSGEIAAARLR